MNLEIVENSNSCRKFQIFTSQLEFLLRKLFKGRNYMGKYSTSVTIPMQSICVVAKLSKPSDMLYQNEEKRLVFPQYENGLNKDIESSDKKRE